MQRFNLYLMNGMYWITASLYLPFISMYFAEKGMNTMEIGILSAIMPMAALVIQPFWSRLSDRPGNRRKVLLILTLCCALSAMLFLLTDTFSEILAAAALYAAFNSAVLPVSDAMVVSQSQKRGLDFARIRMCGTISYGVMVLGVGFYLKEHVQMMFFFIFVSFLAFSAVVMTIPGEGGREAKENERACGGKQRKKLFQSREISFVLTFAFAMQFGVNYYSAFLGVYLLELGHNQSLVGILNCISAFSEIPVLLLMDRISRRYREPVLLSFAVLCMALRLVLLSSGNVALMAASQLLQGPSYMICYFVCVVYVNKMVIPGKLSQGQGVLALVQMGLGSLGGTLIGGMLASRFGTRQGFLIVAVFLLAMAAATSAAYRLYCRGRRQI